MKTAAPKLARFSSLVLATLCVASLPLATSAAQDGAVAASVRAAGKTAGAVQQRRGTTRRPGRTRRMPVHTAAAATPTAAWLSPRSATELSSNLGSMVGGSTRGGTWGVMVVSLTRGDTLYSVNPDELLKPASTMKLMTTALALDKFGPDHTFSTFVLRDGDAANGTLNGNLYLRGGGDPTLSLRFWQNESPMDALAQQVARTGIRRVTGDVIADES